MANLAGFDVIVELHKETIVDLINLQPLTNPGDGKSIYLLGGPFSTDLDADLGPLGVITVRLVLNVGLEAVVHQSLARLVISLTGSTSIVSRALSHIGGQTTVSLPLDFAPPPSGLPVGPQAPVFITRSRRPACRAECGALVTFLAIAGTKPIPAMGFRVVPGIDSKNPFQLSATPVVAWIDKTTLGIFGYYRASASGGNVNNKQTGDLTQSHEEFFYDQPALSACSLGGAPLLSGEAFGMVIACPAVRKQVVLLRREPGSESMG